MRYLFCGLGSIGERHLGNLLSLGETDIIAYRKRNLPLRSVNKKIPIYSDLKKALKQKPDVAFITNPTIYHMPLAIMLAKHNCHLFIEKPLASDLKGVDELFHLTTRKNLIVFVGFTLRFHPAVLQIKKWLKEGVIGCPIFARFNCGEFLPLWHPWEDYRKGYAARKDLGGGPIFTQCHEIDLLSWFFGEPKSIFALASRKSSLKITTEHAVEILLEYPNKLLGEVHIDYLQNPPKRYWEIVGDRGRIEFDYHNNRLFLYSLKPDRLNFKKELINFSNSFERNDKFVTELETFIDCVRHKKQSPIPLQAGINNLKILLAAHQSITKRRIVSLS